MKQRLTRIALCALLLPMIAAVNLEAVRTPGKARAFGVLSMAPQQGGTFQFYQFDPALTTDGSNNGRLCSATVTSDCIKLVRFFRFDGAGNRTDVVDVTWSNFVVCNVAAPCPSAAYVEARFPVPIISSRYSSRVDLFATHVAVDPGGAEVEAVPLATAYQKRPAPGAKFETQKS